MHRHHAISSFISVFVARWNPQVARGLVSRNPDSHCVEAGSAEQRAIVTETRFG
jgi:hypothetical protein